MNSPYLSEYRLQDAHSQAILSNMKINRALFKVIIQKIKTSKKAILLYGARQVGKTTLVQDIIKELPSQKTLSISCDEDKYRQILSSQDLRKLSGLVASYDLFFLDEAQRIPNIGINLKLIIDSFPNLKIIVTGSSSFELRNQVQEPLTGRIWSYNLFPISFSELTNTHNTFELDDTIHERMIFGSYPDVFSFNNYEDKKEYLLELSTSYLYKDIFEITRIKYPEKIRKLLKLLSFQIGQEVSLSELARKIESTKETVNHYIDLLEKSFVIFRLSGFSRNLRKEITKMDKIYFWDLGIRNAVINQFKFFEDRDDEGACWENFLISERFKRNAYQKNGAQGYFWRLHSGAEIDYVEEVDGDLFAYEIKVNAKKIKTPKTWKETYQTATFQVISRDNYQEFLK